MINFKVSLCDKTLFTEYMAKLSIISTVLAFLLIPYELPEEFKNGKTVSFITALLFLFYIFTWFLANYTKATSLKINGTNVEVKVGDIFNEKGLKVIAFNEYFDTSVDDKIIAAKSLNGIFLKSKASETKLIDDAIENDPNLKVISSNPNRIGGKKNKYALGSICKYEDYLLTAFSKFDEHNRANLTVREYTDFFINFWNEVDILHAGRHVSIPLLGSGVTRFTNHCSISEQELLELMLLSFKISRVSFAESVTISIVIYSGNAKNINFYKLGGV